MNSLISASLVASLVLSSVPGFAAVEPAAMSVRSALDAALGYNPDVKTAREALTEFAAVRSQAYSALFPTLTWNGNAAHRKDAANGAAAFGGEAYNTYHFEFDASQPIFDGGASFAALAQANKEEQLRNYDVQIAERGLTLNLIQSFYTVILNERTLANLKKEYEIQKKVLVTAQDRYRIGRGQLLDVLQIKTQMALLEPKIAEAQKNVEISAASLASLLGIHGGKTVSVNGSLDLPLNQFQAAAPQSTTLPEIERIHLQQLQFPDIRSVALAKNYPQVSALASWGRSAYTKEDLFNSYTSSWALTLQLQIPLFSGLSSFGQRRQLASQEAQLAIQEYKTVDQASLNQIQAEKELNLRRDLVSANQKAAQYAVESLQEAEKNYRLQTADFLQLLQVQQNHLDAQTAYDQAKYNYIIAVANYFASTGLPLSQVIDWLDKSSG